MVEEDGKGLRFLYTEIEGIYVNIEQIKGKLQDKLIDEKDNAFMSKQLATIYKEVPVNLTLEDIKYNGENKEELIKTYEELEFYSFLKNMKKENKSISSDVKIIRSINELNINGSVSVYLEILGSNYHTGEILGMGIYDGKYAYYLFFDVLN